MHVKRVAVAVIAFGTILSVACILRVQPWGRAIERSGHGEAHENKSEISRAKSVISTPSPNAASITKGEISSLLPMSLQEMVIRLRKSGDPTIEAFAHAIEIGWNDLTAALKVLADAYSGRDLEERKSELFIALANEDIARLPGLLTFLNDSSWRQQTASAVIATWKKRDPQMLFLVAREGLTGVARSRALGEAAGAVCAQGDFTTAHQYVLEIPQSQERTQALCEIAQVQAHRNVTETLSWIKTFGSPEERRATEMSILPTLVRELSINDLVDAMNALTDESVQHQCAAALSKRLCDVSPDSAIQWATQLPDHFKPAVFSSLAGKVAETDLSRATTFALAAEAKARQAGLRSIATTLVADNPPAAGTWYAGLPLDAQYSVVPALAILWYEHDSASAAAWVGSLQPDKARDAGLLAIVNRISNSDRAAATTYANSISDGTLRARVLARLGPR